MSRLLHILRHLLYRLAVQFTRLLPSAPPRHYRLAILKLDRLGDAALALGAIRTLINHFGAKDTLLIVSPIAAPLLRAQFPNAGFLILPAFCQRFCPDILRFLRQHSADLRSLKIDQLVCLRHPPSDYLHTIVRLIQPQRCHATLWSEPWDTVSWSFPNVLAARQWIHELLDKTGAANTTQLVVLAHAWGLLGTKPATTTGSGASQ